MFKKLILLTFIYSYALTVKYKSNELVNSYNINMIFNIHKIKGVGLIKVNEDFKKHAINRYGVTKVSGSKIRKNLERYLLSKYEIEELSDEHKFIKHSINAFEVNNNLFSIEEIASYI